MISSTTYKALQPYIEILEKSKGKTIGELLFGLNNGKHAHLKKGASGLIIENILGLANNSSPKADLEELGVEFKVLPINLKTLKAKEPTQIKMINYIKVAQESWVTAELRGKIDIVFWIAYGVSKENGKFCSQDKYVILDWFLDAPDNVSTDIFRQDWELIKSYIVQGKADFLSCSMGTYIEPKTKAKNSLDLTPAPDGNGGTIMVRRRAYYFKKNYTNTKVIPKLAGLKIGDA